MPATIGDILKTKPELVTTTPDTFLYEAIELMLRYDYTQLPVLNAEQGVVGLLTSDAVVRALHHFGAIAREPISDADKAKSLRVRDAMFRNVETCSAEDEVFVVHRKLRDANGVLVIDDDGRLIGIVTGYDTTEYLRQRVQDIVLIQDIEETIKAYIKLAFRQTDGALDEPKLQKEINDVVKIQPLQAQLLKRQIDAYLQRKFGAEVALDDQLADDILLQHAADLARGHAFDDLTLASYIQLFMRSGVPLYGAVLQLDNKTIFRMLDSVRKTRNDLAHLRIDITARQRDELRFCREWLNDYYDAVKASLFPQVSATSPLPTVDADPVNTTEPDLGAVPGDESALSPPEEESLAPSESRYAKLAVWLETRPQHEDRITLTFREIEGILGSTLPGSARERRSWWANNSSQHPQAEQWLSAGWRSDEPLPDRELVTFVRTQPRERAYNEFFEALMQQVKQGIDGDVFPPTRTGYYWQSVSRVPEQSPFAGYTTSSFTRNRRPRVDLYIDTGDRERNKAIFDALFARRIQIEEAFGETLRWERLDTKRAARIASYYDEAITIHSSDEALEKLRAWGARALMQLKQAIELPTREVMAALASPTLEAPPATVPAPATDASANGQGGKDIRFDG